MSPITALTDRLTYNSIAATLLYKLKYYGDCKQNLMINLLIYLLVLNNLIQIFLFKNSTIGSDTFRILRV